MCVCLCLFDGDVLCVPVADDGQQMFLHPVNVRCLVREYGSLEASPPAITATVVEVEGQAVTEVNTHTNTHTHTHTNRGGDPDTRTCTHTLSQRSMRIKSLIVKFTHIHYSRMEGGRVI